MKIHPFKLSIVNENHEKNDSMGNGLYFIYGIKGV
jgi:hypothetical protein